MICELCREKPASIEITYGSYQSKKVQILKLCSQCSHELWDEHSLRKLVYVGIVYYSIKGLK